mmetsp:Transcript_113496/g.197117  ORF Transcript_113496/g.197117 Transcript_113496/m.197117 type:complete len:617 (-) Transcript_113496:1344-3194(-)
MDGKNIYIAIALLVGTTQAMTPPLHNSNSARALNIPRAHTQALQQVGPVYVRSTIATTRVQPIYATVEEDLEEKEIQRHQGNTIAVKVAREEKKEKEKGLDAWREKTGKDKSSVRDATRASASMVVDKERALGRAAKESAWDSSETSDVIALGMTDEELEELDARYAKVQSSEGRAKVEEIMLELDSEMEQEKQWQAAIKRTLEAILAQHIQEEELLATDDAGREAALKAKVDVATMREEKKEKQAGLEQWRQKTGKEVRVGKERARKEEQKAITMKRNSQREAKYMAGDVNLNDDTNAEDWQDEANAVEWSSLHKRVSRLSDQLKATRIRNDALRQLLVKEANKLAEEEYFLSTESKEVQAMDEAKAKVKAEQEAKKLKLAGLELWRAKTGKDHLSPHEQLHRKSLGRDITMSRDRRRASKKALVDGEEELSAEDMDAMELNDKYTESFPDIEAMTRRIAFIEQQLEDAERLRKGMQDAILPVDKYHEMLNDIKEAEKQEVDNIRKKKHALEASQSKKAEGLPPKKDREAQKRDDDDDDSTPGAGLAAADEYLNEKEVYPREVQVSFATKLNVTLVSFGAFMVAAVLFVAKQAQVRAEYTLTNEAQLRYLTVEPI